MPIGASLQTSPEGKTLWTPVVVGSLSPRTLMFQSRVEVQAKTPGNPMGSRGFDPWWEFEGETQWR